MLKENKEIVSFFTAGFLVIGVLIYFIYLNQIHQIHCGNYKRMRERNKLRKKNQNKDLEWKKEKIKEAKEEIEKMKEEFKKEPSNFYNFKESSDEEDIV